MSQFESARLAWRLALRRPAFAVAVVTSMAIGMGIVTAAAGLADQVLVRPLPFAQADRVVGIWFQSPNFPGALGRVRQSKGTFLHGQATSKAFSHLALAEQAALTLDAAEHPTRVAGAQVTHEIFDVLSLGVARGRVFNDADDDPGADPVVILTDAAWSSRFGRDEGIVGRAIRVDGVTTRVVGVLPAGVRFPVADTELWVPLVIDASAPDPLNFVYTGYGLLTDGVTMEQATDDYLRGIASLPQAMPTVFPQPLLDRLQLSPLFVPLVDEMVGDVRRPLVLALVAALAVLFAVAANVSNLFLVRHESRHHEFAIRAALGAAPRRLVRAIVVETTAYAVIGGALGLALAAGALSLLRAVAAPVIPRIHEASIDARIAFGAMAMSVGLGVAVGWLSSARARRPDAGSLRAGGSRVSSGRRALRTGWTLVAAQVAFAVVVSTGAGLLARSASRLAAIDPGFDASRVMGLRLFLAATDYPDFVGVSGFYREVVDGIRALPGVESASAVTFLPLRDGRIFFPYEIEGDVRPDGLPVPLLTKLVLDGYFDAMRIPLVTGRVIESHDLDAGTDAVVVNEAFARAYWPTGDAVGKRLRYDTGPNGVWYSVVGVVGDVRDRDITTPASPIAYFPYLSRHAGDRRWRELSLVVRGKAGADVTPSVVDLIARRDGDVPVSDVRPMADVVDAATARTRYTMQLLIACAVAALFLAAVGVYGVLSHVVSGRRREMAVRLALGAAPRGISALVMRQVGLALAAGGLVGGAAALASGQLLAGLLYEVPPTDPWTLGTVVLIMTMVGGVAGALPALRAARIAPIEALRGD